jgi:hypothetical protein
MKNAVSGMLRRVDLVRTDVSEKRIASIKITRIGELGTTLAVTVNQSMRLADSCHPDDGGGTFLGNVVPYKSYTA